MNQTERDFSVAIAKNVAIMIVSKTLVFVVLRHAIKRLAKP